MIRKITKRPSGTKIRCTYFPVGTKLYWYNAGDFVELTPEKKSGFQGVTEVKQCEIQKNNFQTYIPAGYIIKQSGLYELLPKGDALEVHLLAKDVPKTPRHTSGEVIKSCAVHGIYLDPQDANDLHITGYMKVHVVLKPKLYIEVEAISAKEFEILPDQKDLGGFSALRDLPEFTYRYGTSIDGPGKNRLSLPLAFMERTEGKLDTWWEGNKFIVSGTNTVCPTCGRPVYVRHEGLYPAHVCSECAEEKPRERKRLTKEEKSSVLSQLQQMEKMYKQMEESL
jgi:hypothetical protein